ncbi:hypothetical protein JRI60_18450 [Archangium violaceum]|uniref:hypothetical protein n=1 Tax=Archangium violaceum TaxID=83451 RepID=UPI00194EF1AE|nr:hypothetical protein [Archangium violaceum]QRO00866.1 hypothetical protein JRI60_18450 [Archangium violaceum]
MTIPVRRLLPLCLLLVVATSRCSCLTATSSTGTCEGSIGGVDVTGELDPESEHHTVYPPNGGSSQTVLTLSCAKGKLKVNGTLSRVSVLPWDPAKLPPEGGSQACPGTSDGGSPDAGTSDGGTSDAGTGGCSPDAGSSSNRGPVHRWEVLSSDVHPKLVAGLIDAILKLDESIDGTVTMEFEDGSKVTIRFNVYHEDSLDVGEPPSSGGGGGSDFD